MNTRLALLTSLVAIACASGCVVGDGDDDAIGDDGTDEEADTEIIEAGGTGAASLNIGFNNGYADQFAYYDLFFSKAVPSPARLCHAYMSWNVANQAPGAGSIDDHASRAFVDDWFRHAESKCDEALISFKSMTHRAPPSTSEFAAAFEKFAATDWAKEAGFTGKIAFTPWNEPNNAGDAGSGLGVEIPPRVAARYFMVAERSCRKHGCKVAAGDFASNGNMWLDFSWNCANDNVPRADLCKTKSSKNPGGLGPSYLDLYKNEIANGATSLGLPAGFRPAYFAYHGWHDTNRYIDAADHCASYETCAVRRLLRSLGGSWAGATIWNTEDGFGQNTALDDHAQACAASFLLRLDTISPRIHRTYVTRLKGGTLSLLTSAAQPRPAFDVLAKRNTSYAGCN